jgi:hypothetical protein
MFGTHLFALIRELLIHWQCQSLNFARHLKNFLIDYAKVMQVRNQSSRKQMTLKRQNV